jgi:phospholipase/lecithinase/hemolysin
MRSLLLSAFILLTGLFSASAEQPAPVFSQIVVFGDSLSDTGNVRQRTNERSSGLVDYPSETFNYSDGRWTNSSDTEYSGGDFQP